MTGSPTLTGENRIKADRLWRNPKARQAFEQTIKLPCVDYDQAFIRWALDNLDEKFA